MSYFKSCGAVVYTRINGEIKYVLVQSREGVYGFPKGLCECNETEIETALREIYEEVKLTPSIIEGFRATEEYTHPNKVNVYKTVVYFLAEYYDKDIAAQETEVINAPVVSYEEAMRMLIHDDRKRILKEANDYLTKLDCHLK